MRRAVCLSPIPWGGTWTSRHEICSELASRGWDVTFVDPPTNAARRVQAAGGPARPKGLRVITPPPYLPYGVVGKVPALANRVIERNARTYARFVAAASSAGPVDLLINSFMPVLGYRVQELVGPQVTIYHRSDELRQFPGWRAAYQAIEERVAVAADIVVCVSPAVRDGISAVRPDAVVVPNGVNTATFGPGAVPDRRLSDLTRPVSVMMAVFDRRVDAALLEAVSSSSSLVMVGRLNGIEIPPGARWLGHVEHSEIPGILAAADVGVVCYKPTWAGDVLKIYEYLAAGLPVVTSHAPEAAGLREAVAVVEDPEHFAAVVREKAANRSPEEDDARRATVEGHSWASRVDEFLELAGMADPRVAG